MLLADLKPRRCGKHHELVKGILDQLQELPIDSVLKIPRHKLPSLPNVRSAILRATSSREMEISTSSDDENLYVWKKKSPANSKAIPLLPAKSSAP
jgi:hypothetical protein